MKNKYFTKHILSLLFISALISLSGCGGGSSETTIKEIKTYSKDDVFTIKRGQKLVILEQGTTYTSSTNASTNETTISVTKGKLSLN